MSKSKRTRRVRSRQRAKAGRDAYTAGRNLTVVNQYGTSAALFHAGAMPVVLAQLPPMAPGFTGRNSELQLLAGLLDPSGERQQSQVMVSVITGLAGVGKTALAVHAAHAAREVAGSQAARSLLTCMVMTTCQSSRRRPWMHFCARWG